MKNNRFKYIAYRKIIFDIKKIDLLTNQKNNPRTKITSYIY